MQGLTARTIIYILTCCSNLSNLLTSCAVYSALFGTGYFLYGKRLLGSACMIVVVVAGGWIFRNLPRVGFEF